MHPLTPDLSSLKDDELTKKYNELQTKINQAHRFGNFSMVQQIQMIMEDYQYEIARRQQIMMDALAAKSNKFDGIIDIK